MYKIFKADKDTYITNRVIDGDRSYNANVGIAGTLDLFKLYGITLTGSLPNIELSRLLVHFDLTDLTELYAAGKVAPEHSSFFARIQLQDVYGGQPTPNKFTLDVSPLSKSFDEGHGKDVIYYADVDEANFLTASYNESKWIDPGCGSSGDPLVSCDYYTGSLQTSQYFKTGEENLDIDVTSAISGVLTGLIPDEGFRISYSSSEEENTQTYFVKRFVSRHAYDTSKHPKLVVGFDDSIRDTTQGMTFDSNNTMFFYNYDHGEPTNLTQPSGTVSGLNCLILKLQLAISGGYSEHIFTGSQHFLGSNAVTGIYSASVYLSSSNQHIVSSLIASGSSLKFRPIWGSLDGITSFQTGSLITVSTPTRGMTFLSPKKFVVSAYGLSDTYRSDDVAVIKVNIFDHTSPLIKAAKTPVDSPGSLQGTVSDAFYSVRDPVNQTTIIPFDTSKGSTRVSSDASGLYFKLDMSNFVTERSYVVDIMIKVGGEYQRYLNASPIFKVSDL